jgi:hypothetical protein
MEIDEKKVPMSSQEINPTYNPGHANHKRLPSYFLRGGCAVFTSTLPVN